MYEIYTTPAFILSSRTQGESDRYVKFYTKELGLIGARVSASRKEISKHRYSIQPYSFASISLVKGKQGFRLTGIEHEQHIALGEADSSKKSVGNVTALIELLVHGQEQDEDLYMLIEALLKKIPPKQTERYEIYTVVRILKHLGYFDKDFLHDIPETLFDEILPAPEDLLYIEGNKHTYIEYINKCIYESQL